MNEKEELVENKRCLNRLKLKMDGTVIYWINDM